MHNPIGEKLKKLRLKANLTQEALAKKADIPYTSLTKVESGKIKNPSFNFVAKVGEALNVSLDELTK